MVDPTVQAKLTSLVGAHVTQATVSGNTLLLWVGAPPKKADAKCLWVNPPWRVETETGFLVGSADIPWTADDFKSEDAFRSEFERVCNLACAMQSSIIERATALFLSTDLSITFSNGSTLRSFECESGTDESWHLSDYSTMQLFRVAPCGVMVEPLAP